MYPEGVSHGTRHLYSGRCAQLQGSMDLPLQEGSSSTACTKRSYAVLRHARNNHVAPRSQFQGFSVLPGMKIQNARDSATHDADAFLDRSAPTLPVKRRRGPASAPPASLRVVLCMSLIACNAMEQRFKPKQRSVLSFRISQSCPASVAAWDLDAAAAASVTRSAASLPAQLRW